MTQPETIGQFIMRLRTDRQMSIAQLASQTGLSPNAIRWIERGVTQPKPKSLRALSGPLGVSYQELLEKAGYLAQDDNTSGDEQELLALYRQLSPQARQLLQEVLASLNAIAEPPPSG